MKIKLWKKSVFCIRSVTVRFTGSIAQNWCRNKSGRSQEALQRVHKLSRSEMSFVSEVVQAKIMQHSRCNNNKNLNLSYLFKSCHQLYKIAI